MSDKDYEEYLKEREGCHKANGPYLAGFKAWLKRSGLAEKTIKNHLSNVDLYVNVFLFRDDDPEICTGCSQIGSYLGYWFIRKVASSSRGSIKAAATSIKKFYKYMAENGFTRQEDYKYFLEIIKDHMQDWLKEYDRYARYLFSDNDEDFEIF